jgi:hypothetical protein
MNDVRDEPLGAMLDRAAAAIEAEPVDRLPDVLRRGSRRRAARFTAIGATLAVFVGAASWVGLTLPDDDPAIPANVADWRTFASLEENGWTVQVPPTWLIQGFGPCRFSPIHRGAVVTNVDFEFRNRDGALAGCGEPYVWAGFPRDGVALAFQPYEPFGLIFPRPVTPFPLTPDMLSETGAVRGGPSESYTVIRLPGRLPPVAIVRRWVGPEAPPRDVAALDRILGSLQVRGALRWVDAVASTRWLRVGMTHPEGWEVNRFQGVTVIDAPQPILMVTTPQVREGYSFCLGGPFGEFTRLGRFGVVVAISDATGSWIGGPEFGPRPPILRPSEARYDDLVTCSGEVRRLQFQFDEAGRPIVVNVLVSMSLLREQPTVLWHILDSIEISKAS